jgi:DNA-binding NtrC family response regulator
VTNPPKVLIVEDERDISEVVALFLKYDGFSVENVDNRDDALKVLENEKFDIVVMDYFMPGMQAEHFVDELRRRNIRSKVILTSAADRVGSLAEKLSIPNFLGKPFDLESLANMLKRLVMNPKK